MSSLVCALTSPASPKGCPPLFGWFTGCNGTVRLLQHVHVRRAVCGLRGPALIVRPRRVGDRSVLVHVVSQRARVLRLRRTDSHSRFARLPYCLPPTRNGVSTLIYGLSAAQGTPVCPSSRQNGEKTLTNKLRL